MSSVPQRRGRNKGLRDRSNPFPLRETPMQRVNGRRTERRVGLLLHPVSPKKILHELGGLVSR
eukprot:3946461-Lingulodinium_polyedra.AAC.1